MSSYEQEEKELCTSKHAEEWVKDYDRMIKLVEKNLFNQESEIEDRIVLNILSGRISVPPYALILLIKEVFPNFYEHLITREEKYKVAVYSAKWEGKHKGCAQEKLAVLMQQYYGAQPYVSNIFFGFETLGKTFNVLGALNASTLGLFKGDEKLAYNTYKVIQAAKLLDIGFITGDPKYRCERLYGMKGPWIVWHFNIKIRERENVPYFYAPIIAELPWTGRQVPSFSFLKEGEERGILIYPEYQHKQVLEIGKRIQEIFPFEILKFITLEGKFIELLRATCTEVATPDESKRMYLRQLWEMKGSSREERRKVEDDLIEVSSSTTEEYQQKPKSKLRDLIDIATIDMLHKMSYKILSTVGEDLHKLKDMITMVDRKPEKARQLMNMLKQDAYVLHLIDHNIRQKYTVG